MHLLLHIGVSKTGTTSIQRWLSDSCTPVRGDVFVPGHDVLPGTRFGNHLGLPLYSGADLVWKTRLLSDTRNKLPPEFRDLSPERFREAFQSRLTATVDAAAAQGCSTILMSNEHLSERLSGAEIARFTEYLAPLFTSRTLLVYLREQSRGYVSFYCETVKYGSSNRFSTFASQERMQRFFDYWSRLREWEEAGWTIRPRVYYEAGFGPDGWDLIGDFENAVWPGSSSSVDPASTRASYRHNSTLPAGAYAATSYLNYARISPQIRRRFLATFACLPILTSWFARTYEPLLKTIRARHREGNDRVAERYFGRQSLF